MLALQKLKEYAATDRTTIIHRGLRLSYRELDECSDTFAAFLLHHRISVPTERLRSSRLILTLLTEFAVSGGIILLLCAIP